MSWQAVRWGGRYYHFSHFTFTELGLVQIMFEQTIGIVDVQCQGLLLSST